LGDDGVFVGGHGVEHYEGFGVAAEGEGDG
jgi:deoxyinosine 3'endonuclease (endonuclease V)